MHSPMKRTLVVALFTLTLPVPLVALAQGGLKVSLTANRVVSDVRGKEQLEPGDQARPGEVIEYLATYRNPGGSTVQQVEATLPIPQGMEYLPRTARPALVLASLDGKAFEPVPLKRRVRLADGREVLREVPATEYRYLRWSLGAIPGGSAEAVRARVRVSPAAATAGSADKR